MGKNEIKILLHSADEEEEKLQLWQGTKKGETDLPGASSLAQRTLKVFQRDEPITHKGTCGKDT